MPSPKTAAFNARTLLYSWLLVGTLDLALALLSFRIQQPGKPWTIVPRYIASAVAGPDAFRAPGMVSAGIGLHYLIALLFTLFFFLIYRSIRKIPVVVLGLAYGALAWSIMNLLVVPLSRSRPRPLEWEQAAIQMLILILAIGLPLAFIARRAARH